MCFWRVFSGTLYESKFFLLSWFLISKVKKSKTQPIKNPVEPVQVNKFKKFDFEAIETHIESQIEAEQAANEASDDLDQSVKLLCGNSLNALC